MAKGLFYGVGLIISWNTLGCRGGSLVPFERNGVCQIFSPVYVAIACVAHSEYRSPAGQTQEPQRARDGVVAQADVWTGTRALS